MYEHRAGTFLDGKVSVDPHPLNAQPKRALNGAELGTVLMSNEDRCGPGGTDATRAPNTVD